MMNQVAPCRKYCLEPVGILFPLFAKQRGMSALLSCPAVRTRSLTSTGDRTQARAASMRS